MTDDANKFVEIARAQWSNLVRIGVHTPPRYLANAAAILSGAAGVGKSNLHRKLQAIHLAHDSGISEEELVERGQRWTMAKFVKDKRNGRQDEQVCLKWLVSPENRDAAHENVWRIAKVLGFTTSDQLWDFLNAEMTLWSEEEILHSAGRGRKK